MWVPSYVWIFYLICRIQQQQEVLAWLLEPINKMWTQVEWQNAYLSDPSGLTHMFADSQFMWSIYHNITLFEKALKRVGPKSAAAPQALATTVVTGNLHPMCSHLPWILPPLLRVIWHFFLVKTSFFFWCNYYVLAKLIANYSFDITIFPFSLIFSCCDAYIRFGPSPFLSLWQEKSKRQKAWLWRSRPAFLGRQINSPKARLHLLMDCWMFKGRESLRKTP